MFFKNLCIFVRWTKEALALEELKEDIFHPFVSFAHKTAWQFQYSSFLLVFCEFSIYSQVIFINLTGPDDTCQGDPCFQGLTH